MIMIANIMFLRKPVLSLPNLEFPVLLVWSMFIPESFTLRLSEVCIQKIVANLFNVFCNLGIAVGLCSAGGRIGGILCPLVNSTATSLPWLPYAIYGSMSIFQVKTVTRLQETLGKPMLTSIDEAEEFYADPDAKNSEKE